MNSCWEVLVRPAFVPHEMFRSWRCFFLVRADQGQYCRRVTMPFTLRWWHVCIRLMLRRSNYMHLVVCSVQSPESRVHQSVIMSTMLSTGICFQAALWQQKWNYTFCRFHPHHMHEEQQPTRLLHSRPVLQERATTHRSQGRSVFKTVLTRTGHICALRADCGQCSRTVKVARLKACRKRCGSCQKAFTGPLWHADLCLCCSVAVACYVVATRHKRHTVSGISPSPCPDFSSMCG